MRKIAAIAVGALTLAIVATAFADRVDIPAEYDTLNLIAKGNTQFDSAQPPDAYNDDCALGDGAGPGATDIGYSPGNDVEVDGPSDVFDGGLVLWLQQGNNRRVFEDGNGKALQHGDDFLKTGPEKISGLRVTRIEETKIAAPVLRSLIKLKNPNGQAATRTVIWDSDLGADTTEVARASSDGAKGLNDSDRWVVFADSKTSPSDAVGTLVLYGKGAKAQTKVRNPFTNEDGCVSFRMSITVPPKSTRYLLFFTEAHTASEEGVADAGKDARRYNDREPAKVLKGLSDSVRSKVLNWDLG